MRTMARILVVLLLLAGIGMILYPNLRAGLSWWENEQAVRQVDQRRTEARQEKESDSQAATTVPPEPEADAQPERAYQALYEDMQAYNETLYETKQESLTDAWSYQQTPFELTQYGVIDDAVGYLTIDAMDLQLALYLGAVDGNLSRGAAVLGETSMPIGGLNTNCVIAGHRGWKGIPMFREIEKLELGDSVVLDNLWETLHYEVVEIQVVTPDQIDVVQIQEGRDLLTLITCHPYRHNYQRYVVFCERVEEEREEESLPETAASDHTEVETAPSQPTEVQPTLQLESSQGEIDQEKRMNQMGVGLVGVLLVGMLAACLLRKKKRAGDK